MPPRQQQRQQQRQQPGMSEAAILGAISVVLMAGLSAEATTRLIGGLVAALGVPMAAVGAMVELVLPHVRTPLDEEGAALAAVSRGRPARSSAFLMNGLRRVAAEPSLPPIELAGADVAVGALLRERFGPEVGDRLVGPLLGGVYAGRTEVLGLRATMPLLASALDRGVQGNLEPAVLLGPWERVEDATRDVLERARGRAGHIFNLGHGVLPDTDPDMITKAVEWVHRAR